MLRSENPWPSAGKLGCAHDRGEYPGAIPPLPGVLTIAGIRSPARSLRPPPVAAAKSLVCSSSSRSAMWVTPGPPWQRRLRTSRHCRLPGPLRAEESDAGRWANDRQDIPSLRGASEFVFFCFDATPQCSGTAMLCAVRDRKCVLGRDFAVPISWCTTPMGAVSGSQKQRASVPLLSGMSRRAWFHPAAKGGQATMPALPISPIPSASVLVVATKEQAIVYSRRRG